MPDTADELLARIKQRGQSAPDTADSLLARVGSRATPDQAATARTAIFGSADPDSQPAPDEMVDALLDSQGHGQRVESEIAKYSKELDRESFPGIFKAAPSAQALEFERMGGAEGYRKAERDLAIERMGGRPTMGAARRSLSVTDSEARAAEDQAKIRQSENPILRYGARLATDFKEGYENAGAWVRESLIRPVAPEAARALDSLSSRAGMSEEGKAIVRKDTKGLLGDIIGMVGQTAAFIPQVAIGGVPGAAAVSAAASGGDAMAGLETAAFLKTAGGLTRLFGGASESVIRQVLAEGAAMTAAGAATRLGFHGDPGTLQQAGVDALSGLAFGVMGGGARAREAAARFRSGLEAGKTIETAAREAGIPPERLADPTPPVEAPRPAAADPVRAPERAPEIAPQSGVVTPTPVDAPAPTKPVSVAPVAAERLFHGSPRTDLSVVQANPQARQYDNATSQFGAFFSPSEGEASRYAGKGGRVYAADVQLSRPYEMPWSEFNKFQSPDKGPDGKTIADFSEAGLARRTEELKSEAANLRRDLESQGYDGVIVRSGRGRVLEVASFKDVPLPESAAPAEAPAPRPVERPAEPPRAPEPPSPPVVPAPEGRPEGEGFSIKNAAVAERREARGAEPLEKSAPQTREGWNAEAEKQMAENPNKPYEVMADLKRTGRAHTPVEVAILTRHQKNLNDAYKKAYDDITAAAGKGEAGADAVKEAKARAADILLKDIEAAESISGNAGSEAGRSLAARQMALAEDYSVLALTRERTIANDGKPLSNELQAKIADISTRMDSIQRELDTLRSTRATKAPDGKTVTVADVKSAEYGKRNTIVTRDAYEATRAALREKLNRMSVNPFDPTILADLVKMGTFHVEAGIRNFAAWSKAMKDELGEKVEPYLKDAWRESQSKAGKPLADAKAALAEGAKAGKSATDSPAAIQKLAEYFVREGVTDRSELISKVHEALQESSPGITYRQTMDAISGYGVYKSLNNDPAKIRLRELKTEMQQLAKLEDMASGQAPKKTGLERQPMTDEARELTREVNQKKREGGYEVADPARELKTALDATKTRLRNEIADLSRQIATKTKDIPNKTKLALDPEAQALKKRRDELKADYVATFGKPEMTDAQRLEAAVRASERSIAALEKQIERGDVFPEAKPAPLTDARLEALKARREELNKKREDLRASALEGSQPSKVQQGIDRAVAALDKSITEYKAKLTTGNIAPRPKGASGPTSPKIEALRAERDALRKQMDAARNAARPRLPADVIARKSRMTRIQRAIDKLEAQIAAKDFTKKQRAVNIPDMAEARLLAKQELVRQEWQHEKMKDEWQKKTLPQRIKSLAVNGFPNLSRAIMTAYDFSVALKQAAPLVARSPRDAARNLGPGLKSMGSFREGKQAFSAEMAASHNPIKAMWKAVSAAGKAGDEAAARYDQQIRLDADYHRVKQGELFLGDLHGGTLNKMEEALIGGIIGKIPGVGASQRFYTTFLNKMRFDAFKSGLATLSADGKAPTPLEVRTWANAINTFTGRGGAVDSKFLNGLNNVFFAPRLVASRFGVLLGTPLWKGELAGTGRVRGMIATQLYARFAAGIGLFYSLSLAAGGEVEEDGRVRFGSAVLDPTAGLATVYRLLGKTLPGVYRGVTGQDQPKRKFGERTELQEVADFARNKLAPIYGAVTSATLGEKPGGDKTDAKTELAGLFTPMSVRDVYKAMVEHGVPKGTALGILALTGVGLQNYPKRPKKRKLWR